MAKYYYVLLFLLLPVCLSAQSITLSEAEYQTIMTALDESEKELIEQQNSIDSLEKTLIAQNDTIKQQEKQQAISDEITSQLLKESERLKMYSEEQKKETIKDKIFTFLDGFLWGSLTILFVSLMHSSGFF